MTVRTANGAGPDSLLWQRFEMARLLGRAHMILRSSRADSVWKERQRVQWLVDFQSFDERTQRVVDSCLDAQRQDGLPDIAGSMGCKRVGPP